ncbi:nitroreductase [Microbaculum marinum]|uniref:Nitroreductase n=1 Tax=Microbaculum marinum TaxID=1764581 RepID=A0AAW9RTQ8_9HYPH
MNVTEAVRSRLSCRAFLDTPVPESVVREILDAARWAPSGGNLQPWRVHVLTGAPLKDLIERISPRYHLLPKGEGPDYQVYPHPLREPYHGRRFKCGADLYAALGIPREDKAGRYRQFARNFTFFGAPVGIFVSIDRQMGPPQWADAGMFVQTIMLLAREHGLHSCAQEAWTYWHETVAQVLDLPDELIMYCGIALGYADMDDPVNGWRTERAAVDELAEFRGFEAAPAE